ncbi:MAG: threonine/serine dehydratase [Parvularculaceae bacterium]
MVTIADINHAGQQLAPHLAPTPLLESEALNQIAGGRVFIKPENLQQTGSFKIRGALNRLLHFTATEKAAGVVAYSSGNHAQGVACAAKMLGIPATIVMPSDAPALKIDRTRGLGATVILYERAAQNREEIARSIAAEKDAVLVPPFDDHHVIAGQGTAGAEIAAALIDQNLTPDQFACPCSGGGLGGGSIIALRDKFPDLASYIVEPQGFDDTARALASGTVTPNQPGANSICDALLLPQPGVMTLPILHQTKTQGLVVSDAQTRNAMRFAFRDLKLVVEPGGAVALAAVLSGQLQSAGKTTAIILSGGNVDPALFAAILSSSD